MLGRMLREWWQRRGANPAQSRAHALALYRQGAAMASARRFDDAADCYRRALLLDPMLAEADNNLGQIHEFAGNDAAAEACYHRAIAAKPELAEPYVNLGNLAFRAKGLDAASGWYEQALVRDPGNWEANNNRANIFLVRGERDAARAAFAVATRLRPDDPVAASNQLNCDVAAFGERPDELFREYVDWGRRFADTLPRPQQYANTREPGRRLKLGYVSADFRKHAMGYFLEPLLAHRDAAGFEIYCYYNWPRSDTGTARFKSLSDHWRDVAEVSDDEVAHQISDDGIDLLVDLAGHSSDNRLLVFARKPAPVQLTYLGYPNTTGVTAIDYRITDHFTDPPGMNERYYVERLLRLPDCMWCYRGPDYAPDVGPLPALANGYVTFGSFNSFMKITDDTIDTWATLMRRMPDARLLMVTVAPGAAQRRALAAFAGRGIDASRIELLPRMDADAYLALRNRVDIALDPFPVNGGTTTCDSLWMGVPSITLAGRVFVSRAGVSLMHNVGLPELVAQDTDHYVELAATLAQDLPRMAALRASLRERMRASPLGDAPRFVANLESLYRDAWSAWCAGRYAGEPAALAPATSTSAP